MPELGRQLADNIKHKPGARLPLLTSNYLPSQSIVITTPRPVPNYTA